MVTGCAVFSCSTGVPLGWLPDPKAHRSAFGGYCPAPRLGRRDCERPARHTQVGHGRLLSQLHRKPPLGKKKTYKNRPPLGLSSINRCKHWYMETFFYQASGWLSASGQTLRDYLPSGSGICRVIDVQPQVYSTGFVSTNEGSFKASGVAANWYGTSSGVAFAETRPTGLPICEYSLLTQDIPVLNMCRLPRQFLDAIAADCDLASGRFVKSQFVMQCLEKSDAATGTSGVRFPSRRCDGDVVVVNPQLGGMAVLSTGQSMPTALPQLQPTGQNRVTAIPTVKKDESVRSTTSGCGACSVPSGVRLA